MSKPALLGGPKAVTEPFPSWPIWDDEDKRAVLGVLESGKWWMYGYGEQELGGEAGGRRPRSQVEQFEEEFAALHRVLHGIAVTSGSTALDICMRAIDLHPGDEVITTPYTFFATSSCILNANALPVYVDVDPHTYNIDPTRIEEAITERTRAILPVHFAGELCDMEAIGRIATRHGLRVIEDAAQAQGVCLKGRRYAASFGEAGIFSFQASKCLNCGEGGIILTNSDEMADRLWGLRHHGRTRQGLWYEHHKLGWNARMTEWQGALLRTQLRKLPDQNTLRMANVRYFFDGLRRIGGLTPVKLHPDGETHSHYLVMLRYDASAFGGLPRERFLEALNAEGVPASGGYSFCSFENPLFRNLDLALPIDYRGFAEKCPNAMRACREEAVWLMHNLFLGQTRHVDMILEAVGKIRESYAALR
jgi:dTDP-4-amino-4,6-dideoxygalactose transaminase